MPDSERDKDGRPIVHMRDYFAAGAMQAMVSDGWLRPEDVKTIAERSYLLADAMMIERDQERNKAQ